MSLLSPKEAVIGGCVLILAVLLIRQIFGGRLPRRALLVLWEIAILRLLIPVALPTQISVYNLDVIGAGKQILAQSGVDFDEIKINSGEVQLKSDKIPPESDENQLNPGTASPESGENQLNPNEIPPESGKAQLNPAEPQHSYTPKSGEAPVKPNESPVKSGENQPAYSENPPDSSKVPLKPSEDLSPNPDKIPLKKILTAVYLTGDVLMALAFTLTRAVCGLKFRRRTPYSCPEFEEAKADFHLRRPVTLCRLPGSSSPLTYGILRPVVLLPERHFTPEQLKFILTHELTHVRCFDGLRKILSSAALVLHWYNPLVWLMYGLYNRDIELACDEAVVRRLGIERKADYAMTIIAMKSSSNAYDYGYSSFSKISGKYAAEERIGFIMKIKKKTTAALILACIVVSTVAGAFATSADDKTSAGDGKKTVALTTPAETQAGESSPEEAFTPPDKITEIFTEATLDTLNSAEYDDSIKLWTAEEYEKWLEAKRDFLPSVIGDWGIRYSPQLNYIKSYFQWTKEMIDEKIADYEKTLEEIKNGAKYINTTKNGLIIKKYPIIHTTNIDHDELYQNVNKLRMDEAVTSLEKTLMRIEVREQHLEELNMVIEGYTNKINEINKKIEASEGTPADKTKLQSKLTELTKSLEEIKKKKKETSDTLNFLKEKQVAFEDFIAELENEEDLSETVEWWTAEEYEKWLEQQRKELPSIIGDWGWTKSMGWFEWTQELVDETLKKYEATLAEIKNGLKLSKPDENGVVMMSCYPDTTATEVESSDVVTDENHEAHHPDRHHNSTTSTAENSTYAFDDCGAAESFANYCGCFDEYKTLGLSVSKDGKTLMFGNKTVGYFMDEYKPGAFNRWCGPGEIGVLAVRDGNNKLTALTECTIPAVNPDSVDAYTFEAGACDVNGDVCSVTVAQKCDADVYSSAVFQSACDDTVTTADGAEFNYNGKTLVEFVNRYAEFGLKCEKISDSKYKITLDGEEVNVFVDDCPGEYVISYSDEFRRDNPKSDYTCAQILYKDGKPCGVDFKTVTPDK